MGDSSTRHNTNKSIPPEVCKKLLKYHGCDKRVTNNAAEGIGEVLRMFIVEARARASIEAECDLEGGLNDDDQADSTNVVSIRADHITKVAAELLMDFS
eukprot:Nitzschia sp. Nitz4//scaffold62_size106224//103856//104234//NITZ4_004375-RA/size106224-snap-gene-0.120-mRNA-1//1//CDS//3329555913//1306//frame0